MRGSCPTDPLVPLPTQCTFYCKSPAEADTAARGQSRTRTRTSSGSTSEVPLIKLRKPALNPVMRTTMRRECGVQKFHFMSSSLTRKMTPKDKQRTYCCCSSGAAGGAVGGGAGGGAGGADRRAAGGAAGGADDAPRLKRTAGKTGNGELRSSSSFSTLRQTRTHSV